MKVKIPEVHDTLLKIILDGSKLSKADADILATDYLEGELQGKHSHGIAAFPEIVKKLAEAKSSFRVLKETESFLYANAEGSLGAIVGRKLADIALDKADKQGVGLVVIRDMKSWLRPAVIAQHIANNNMVAWVVNTGGMPMVAPPGGRDPVVGTNPIGIGIPSGESPLIMDMATSTRAWGEVRLAKRFNHDLPENSFVDSDGVPTLDADLAHAAIPAGGYKGFGLGLLIEILGGSLVGMHMGKSDSDEDYGIRNRGAVILVINPEMTVGSSQFKTENQQFIDSVKQTPAAKGSNGVTIPGDRSLKTKQANNAKGYLEIDDKLWSEITGLL